jgi:hypothetical protein
MRKLGLIAIFVGFFLFAGCASATTYYISFSSGSNANNGTSESTPWKTHPYMQTGSGCTGNGAAPNYSHSAGDQFIFKQGDSWPNACFDMTIQNGGASGNPDVYTFDPSWGTAGGTTGNLGQAVGTYQFNAGSSIIKGADGYNTFILVNTNYVTLNGIEFTGFAWTDASCATFGSCVGVYVGTQTNIIVSNAYMHKWSHSGASQDDLDWMEGNGGSPNSAGDRLTGSVIDGTGASDSGSATFAIPLSDNNIIKNMANGLLMNANAVVYNNQIGPINQSFDTTVHENCIEPIDGVSSGTSTVYIYNNLIHDCTAVGILTEGVAPSGSNEVDYIWNNVYYVGSVSSPPIPFQFDSSLSPNTGSSVHAWNNTIYAGSGTYCMRTIDRGDGNYAVLDIENNHCISDQGTISLGITGSTYTNKNNVLMGTATAAAQGYTSSEAYAYSPTAATDGTVGAGINLTSLVTGATAILGTLTADTTYTGIRLTQSRPATGPWDAGAYEFSSTGTSGAPAPPTNVKILVVQ